MGRSSDFAISTTSIWFFASRNAAVATAERVRIPFELQTSKYFLMSAGFPVA